MKTLFFVAVSMAWAVVQWVGAASGGDAAIGCVAPVHEKTLTVHFVRTLGVPDFRGFPDVNLEAMQLSPEETIQLRKMIADASFFELNSSPPPPLGVPDPPAGYDLTVTMDGRTHTIWVTDGDVGKSLQPLIDWLSLRAKASDKKNQTAPVAARC